MAGPTIRAMQRDQRATRFIRRLETEFTSNGSTRRALSSDLSETGLFIRTIKPLVEGTQLDLKIYLSAEKYCLLRGIVTRSIRTAEPRLTKNGMGVRLTSVDSAYLQLLNEMGGARHTILRCASCGAKNKVPIDRLSSGPRCGKCKNPLQIP